jgi:hypothetical protein
MFGLFLGWDIRVFESSWFFSFVRETFGAWNCRFGVR